MPHVYGHPPGLPTFAGRGQTFRRPPTGEIVQGPDGRQYLRQPDGSLRPLPAAPLDPTRGFGESLPGPVGTPQPQPTLQPPRPRFGGQIAPRRVGPPIGSFMSRAEANSALAARGGGGQVVRSPATGMWQIEGSPGQRGIRPRKRGPRGASPPRGTGRREPSPRRPIGGTTWPTRPGTRVEPTPIPVSPPYPPGGLPMTPYSR